MFSLIGFNESGEIKLSFSEHSVRVESLDHWATVSGSDMASRDYSYDSVEIDKLRCVNHKYDVW